jgi:hypothetical protein
MNSRLFQLGVAACAAVLLAALSSCGRSVQPAAPITAGQDPTVGVVKVADRPMNQDITISSELWYERLAGVAKSNPGMVAQQEVDEARGKDLAAP